VYVSTRVQGLNQLVRGLQAAGVEVEDLKAAFAPIAQRGADLASSFAPRRSGKLAGSVRGNRAKNKAVVTAGRAAVKYAGAINYGWPAHGIPASSFMQRADRELGPEAPRLVEDAIRELLKREGLS
jgi:hypothetical protein